MKSRRNFFVYWGKSMAPLKIVMKGRADGEGCPIEISESPQ